MKNKVILIFILTLGPFIAKAQDTAYVRNQIGILSSKDFWGRGYVNKGVNKAAKHIYSEMKDIGLSYFGDSYFQELEFPVNTFSGNITVKIDDKTLITGEDYFIGPACPEVDQEYSVVSFDSAVIADTLRFLVNAGKMNLQDKLLAIDFSYITNSDIRWFYVNLMKFNYLKAAGFVELSADELAWAVRGAQQLYPVLKIRKSSFPPDTKKVYIKVKPKLIDSYKTENVIGYVPGAGEEYVVICAHYDHLGKMGKNVFIPGANDNASGTSMVLDFARYYKNNPCKYNMVFMLFTGEEAGLHGSEFYVKNPLFPLDKIKFVINLDMVGTGEKGIAIVGGEAPGYESIAATFKAINLRNEYFTEIKLRGESKNSDHYPFYAKGIKAVFFYTMGANTFYHNPKDVSKNLTLTGYIPLFRLINDFVKEYE